MILNIKFIRKIIVFALYHPHDKPTTGKPGPRTKTYPDFKQLLCQPVFDINARASFM